MTEADIIFETAPSLQEWVHYDDVCHGTPTIEGLHEYDWRWYFRAVEVATQYQKEVN